MKISGILYIIVKMLCNNGDNEEIKSVKYLNNELLADYKDGKGIRYDIMCETASHHRFIMEMHKADQSYFVDSKPYT